jgi:hypothetical protein
MAPQRKNFVDPSKFLAITSLILSCLPLLSELELLNLFAPANYAVPAPISRLLALFGPLFFFAPALGLSGILAGSFALYLNSKSSKNRWTLLLAVVGVTLGALVLLALAVAVAFLIYLALTMPLDD